MKPIIGIPVYQDHECFEEMFRSLINSTHYYDRILIITSDEDIEYWRNFTSYYSLLDLEVINIPKEGPLKAYNKLFQIAKKERKDLLITQTDVLFPRLYKRDWLQLMSQFAQKDDVGLVIPLNGGGVSGPTYMQGLPWVGGWCTYISNKCWNIFTEYDENYPDGWGVDIDMTYQITRKYKIMQINYWVDHHMLNERKHETNPNSELNKQKASEYFKNKWSIK